MATAKSDWMAKRIRQPCCGRTRCARAADARARPKTMSSRAPAKNVLAVILSSAEGPACCRPERWRRTSCQLASLRHAGHQALMTISVCPTAVCLAPADRVWPLLADPARYDEWCDAHAEHVEPPGLVQPGQQMDMRTPARGRWIKLRFVVEAVDAARRVLA